MLVSITSLLIHVRSSTPLTRRNFLNRENLVVAHRAADGEHHVARRFAVGLRQSWTDQGNP